MMKRDELIGTWRLESCVVLDNGRVLKPFGDAPVGLLTYTGDGTMTAAIMRADRPRCNANDILRATPEEKAAAVDGYLSYAGRFEVVGDRVRHHVEVSLFQNWVDTTQERNVRIDGDSLELSSDPILLGGSERVAMMGWRRRT